MQFTGTAHMNAPVAVAWKAFHDPGVLSRTIPGLQSLTATGEDEYDAVVSAGVASIKGTYAGHVALTEQHELESFLLKASGEGGPGTISADVRVRLSDAEDGGTDIVWGADASVGGAIGGVGQRMLQGVARKMATQFFAAIDNDIATGGHATPPSGEADEAQGSAKDAAPAAAPGGQPGRAAHRPLPAASAAAGGSRGDLLVGAAVGAAIALLGVALGMRAGRG